VIIAALIVVVLTSPVQAETTVPPDANAQTKAAADGIWPTDTMIEGFLARWADETAKEFELTAPQRDGFRATIMQQWPAFLKAHRPELQPLLNEYLDTRLATDAPDPKRVQGWAERAGPVFDEFGREMRESYARLSEVMTPEQQARLRLEMIKVNTRLQRIEVQLQAWRGGRFESRDWWDDSGRIRRGSAGARSADSGEDAGSAGTPSRIDEELLRWDRFVLRFTEKYGLDDRQREAAFSILRECKDKVLGHRERYRERIARLEEALNRSHPVPIELKAEALEIYGPIDAVFVELRLRLDQIPTQAQIEAVEGQPPEARRDSSDE